MNNPMDWNEETIDFALLDIKKSNIEFINY